MACVGMCRFCHQGRKEYTKYNDDELNECVSCLRLFCSYHTDWQTSERVCSIDDVSACVTVGVRAPVICFECSTLFYQRK